MEFSVGASSQVHVLAGLLVANATGDCITALEDMNS